MIQPDAASAQGQSVRFTVDGPDRVGLENPFDIRFSVDGVENLAGFEAIVLYNSNVAIFRGHHLRNSDLAVNGRSVGPLTAIDERYGIAIGAYTCSAGSCFESHAGNVDSGGDGSVRLGSISMLPTREGRIEFRVVSIKLVNARGEEIVPNLPPERFVVEVGERPSRGFYRAPKAPWQLKPDPKLARNFDVVADQVVSYADAAEVAVAWVDRRELNAPCGPLWDPAIDVNQDGCVDVADVQLIAANFGGDTIEQPPLDDGRGNVPEFERNLAQAGTTFTVNSTGDEDDINIGNGVCQTSAGTCTLRAAIREANTNAGPNTIAFNIPGGGVQQIQLNNQLPALGDQSGGTTIDGYTQPGASVNTDALASNANLQIQLRGGGEDQYVAIKVTSSNNVIRGLSIFRFRKAVWIFGSGASNNTLAGNFVGTDAAGNYISPVVLGAGHGVHIEQGANSNTIGQPNLADRNIISGNGRHGLGIWHAPSNDNVIQNNIVGLDPTGTAARPNRKHGIDLNFGSSNNIIGGNGPNERNVSSGNDDTGVEISHLASTSGNVVIGNFIGTDLTGNGAPAYAANQGRGIMLEDGVRNNIIEDNVIVNSQQSAGIEVRHDYTTSNIIRNNRIGLTLNGAPGPNPGGIEINGSNTIVGPGNVIAFNQFAGVNLGDDDGDFNTITQNSIYANNGLGINIAPGGVNPNDPGDADTGPNQELNYPVLDTPSETEVTGTACANCVVEIFVADSAAGVHGEGMTFIASGSADGAGNFTIPISGQSPGTVLTATATDQTGNTSEFSLNQEIAGSNPRIKDMTFENGLIVHPVTGADSDFGSITASPTTSISGSFSAFVDTNSPSRAYLQEDFIPAPDFYAAFEIRIDQLPSSNFRMVEIYNLGTLVGNVGLSEDGVLSLRNGSTLIGESTPLQPGVVYRVGIHQQRGAGGNAVLEAFLVQGTGGFGAAFASTSTGAWTTQATRFRLGTNTSSAVEVRFDNVSLDTVAMP